MPEAEHDTDSTPDSAQKAAEDPAGSVGQDAAAERRRRLRAARLLGDVVPSTTRDETSEGWSERDSTRDDELRRDVPPHHGG